MTATADRQEHVFQAEIKRLLHLLANSLYQGKEIALRELVSNASDALDKMRFVGLTDPDQRETGELCVFFERDEQAKTLAVCDTGVGMTREELVHNLGTIAHSGSLEFLQTATGDAKKDLSLIGQIGVRFYSSFMLADKVEVLTRS